MTAFSLVMLWLAAIWLVYTWRESPLQPDQLEDGLGELDMSELAYRRLMREADWLSAPKINLRLSGKWVRR